MKKVYNEVSLETVGPLAKDISDIVLSSKKPFTIVLSDETAHSSKLLTRFHAHLTIVWKWATQNIEELQGYSREEFKIRVLFYACSIPDESLLEGCSPWPMIRVKIKTIQGKTDWGLIPFPSTSDSSISNNQLLTAYWALTLRADEWEIVLPERHKEILND